MNFHIFSFCLFGLSIQLNSPYLRIHIDPGTYSACMTQYIFSTRVEMPEACPVACEKKLRDKNFKLVSKYTLVSSKCDCFRAIQLCGNDSNSITSESALFYVDSDLWADRKHEGCSDMTCRQSFDSVCHKLTPAYVTEFDDSACMPCSPDRTGHREETRKCIWMGVDVSDNTSCVVKESSENSEACGFVDLTKPCNHNWEFEAYLTEFNDTECNKCAPNGISELRRRECVWFEGSKEQQCVERRSSTNSTRCGNASLTMPCPLNDQYTPYLTNFISESCDDCSPLAGKKYKSRQCAWFEATNEQSVCNKVLSEVNSERCGNAKLTRRCPTKSEFLPKVTAFDNSTYEENHVVKTRECLWYEKTSNGVCRQNRSSNDSQKCNQQPLVASRLLIGDFRVKTGNTLNALTPDHAQFYGLTNQGVRCEFPLIDGTEHMNKRDTASSLFGLTVECDGIFNGPFFAELTATMPDSSNGWLCPWAQVTFDGVIKRYYPNSGEYVMKKTETRFFPV